MSAAEILYVVTTTHGSYYVKASCEHEAGKLAVARLSQRHPRETVRILVINVAL